MLKDGESIFVKEIRGARQSQFLIPQDREHQDIHHR